MNTPPRVTRSRARQLTTAQRLAEFVKPDGTCLVWVGSRDRDGYGRTRNSGGPSRRVHRIAWELAHGTIPDGLIVRHRCDNPPCINVDHLELGTTADNNRDRHIRGRDVRGHRQHSSKLTPDDVRVIRARLHTGETCTPIARDYGVRPWTIQGIRDGRTWGWLQ